MIAVPVIGILVSIAIPQFQSYRMRSYDITARNDLFNASAAQEGYYADNNKYTDSLKDIVGDRYGFFVSKGVTVRIISADKYRYCMVAFHKNSNKKYQINGPDIKITEASINSTESIKEETQDEIPEEEMAGEIPEEEMPDEMTEDMPDEMTEDIPDGMTEDIPDGIVDDIERTAWEELSHWGMLLKV